MHNHKRRNFNRNDRPNDRFDRGFENRDKNDEIPEVKKYSKGLILLKSSVFALFIVLVTLVAAFIIIKNRKIENIAENGCDKNPMIKIANEIEKIDEKNNVISVLTKKKDGKQELIRFAADCGAELSRVTFHE